MPPTPLDADDVDPVVVPELLVAPVVELELGGEPPSPTYTGASRHPESRSRAHPARTREAISLSVAEPSR